MRTAPNIPPVIPVAPMATDQSHVRRRSSPGCKRTRIAHGSTAIAATTPQWPTATRVSVKGLAAYSRADARRAGAVAFGRSRHAPANATAMATPSSALPAMGPPTIVEAHASITPSGTRRDNSGPSAHTPRGTGIVGVKTRSRFSSEPGASAGPRTKSASAAPATHGAARRRAD